MGRGEGKCRGLRRRGGGGEEGLLDILDPRIKEKKVAEPQIFITFSNRIYIWKNRFYVSRETVSGHPCQRLQKYL
jgi:hypothetical protein